MNKLARLWGKFPVALPVFFSFFFQQSFSQSQPLANQVARKVETLRKAGSFDKQSSLFQLHAGTSLDSDIEKTVKKYALLDVSNTDVVERSAPALLSFTVPVPGEARLLRILLFKENLSPNGFRLLTQKGEVPAAGQKVLHYRGSIDNDAASVAAFSFYNGEVSGMISNRDGNYVIGKIDKAGAPHIVYNDRDLVAPQPFNCAANTFLPVSPVTMARPGEAAAVTNKCVNWYWETDYDLFVNKGSVANVNAYMQGLFNQMATLYANDGMTMVLKTLFVWSAEDPYTGTSTSGYLNQFGAYRTSFDGDLAHLIGLKGGGGIAWINGACKTNKYRMAYSGISSTYSVVPTFSWSVECVTHEQGHLLGSPHTHDCSWNGNNTKIDGCGDAAGYSSGTCAVPPLPAGGGTIMSYCHLTSAGINLNLGFGPQPSTLMINTINAASCLVACTTACTLPAQPVAITGNGSACPGSFQNYSVAAVSGATSYVWTLPAGWTGTSTTNTIRISMGTTSGTISVAAKNSCGNSIAQTRSVVIASVPSQPSVIAGNTAVCSGSSQVYAVTAGGGATSFTWTLPAGWTGTSTTNTITVTPGTTGGTLSVKGNNACGSGVARTTSVSITTAVPAQPGSITVSGGTTLVCTGNTRTYSVPLVTGVNYLWTLPAGVTITGAQNANSIQVSFGSSFVSGSTLSVKAVNGCGSSTASSIVISKSSITAPGSISVSGGSARVCAGDVRTYSVPSVAGISYNWIAPTGAAVTSGQGTATALVTYGSGFVAQGTLSVTANTNCGASAARTLTVTRNTLATPAGITGSSAVCPNALIGYSVAAVSGATSYLWTVPSGASIQGAANGNSIQVRWGTTGGNITVRAVNACGNSSARSTAVSISCTGGIEQITMAAKAVVYPNPANKNITVNFTAEESGTYQLSITDATGRRLLVKTVKAVQGLNQQRFDISRFSKGSYIIVIQGNRSKELLQLVIE